MRRGYLDGFYLANTFKYFMLCLEISWEVWLYDAKHIISSSVQHFLSPFFFSLKLVVRMLHCHIFFGNLLFVSLGLFHFPICYNQYWPLLVSSVFRHLTSMLALGWRIRLTKHLLKNYLRNNAYYKVIRINEVYVLLIYFSKLNLKTISVYLDMYHFMCIMLQLTQLQSRISKL